MPLKLISVILTVVLFAQQVQLFLNIVDDPVLSLAERSLISLHLELKKHLIHDILKLID